MATDQSTKTKASSTEPVADRNRRSRPLIAAVTALLVLVVGLGTWAIVGGEKQAAVDPDVAAVLAAFEARNAGDIDAYLASLSGEELNVERDVHVSEALSYANARVELVDCRVTGPATTDDSLVECEFTETDDFYGAGGIVDMGTATFRVTQEGKISEWSGGSNIPWDQTEKGMFNVAFFSWLMEAHPPVFEVLGPERVVNNPGIFANPTNMSNIPGLNWPANRNFGSADPHEADEMLIALEYVDEFVAQSDVYPLGS